MISELSEVEEIILELMTQIDRYENDTVDKADLKQWYDKLDNARFLLKDILADEADRFDYCD